MKDFIKVHGKNTNTVALIKLDSIIAITDNIIYYNGGAGNNMLNLSINESTQRLWDKQIKDNNKFICCHPQTNNDAIIINSNYIFSVIQPQDALSGSKIGFYSALNITDILCFESVDKIEKMLNRPGA